MAGPDPATQGPGSISERLNREKHERHEDTDALRLAEHFVFFVKLVVQS